MRTLIVSVAVALALSPSSLSAGDWPHFRGPSYDGSTAEKNLPSTWSTTENIAWTAELPGPSAATPIVWKDRIFLSSTDADAGTLQARCLDREDGKLLWKHDVSEEIGRTHRSNYASPSPTTDGEVVVFFYGNGELVAFDFDGKRLWGRNIQKDYGEFAFLWTFASSPLLYRGKLYLQVLQRDTPVDGRGFEDRENESYLLAMEPKSGKTLWRHVRPSKARAESREAFSSPVPLERDGKGSILIAGGDALSAHDPETGDELWRWGTWNPTRIGHWRHVPSPVSGDNVVLVCAPKKDPIYAVKLGGTGQLDNDAVAWVSEGVREVSSDVPTPAYYDGDFFVLSDVRKSLSRVVPGTGEVKWTVKTPGLAKYEASPLAADGKIYIINFKGDVAVFDAKDGSTLGVNAMEATGEYPIRSSIVASGGQLLIRTNRKLYCVGER